MTSAPRSTRCDVIAAGPSNEHSITRIPSSIDGLASAIFVTPPSNRRRKTTAWVALRRKLGLGWSSGPHDGLHLGVGEQSEVAAVTADAAHLEAAERRFHVPLRSIDADVARAQLARH